MIYLYFDAEDKRLFLCDKGYLGGSGRLAIQCRWDNIETVTADHDRKQILAHKIGTGIVAEFPIGSTILTCQLPEN